MDGAIELADGRMIGYATYGHSRGTPVIWCHRGQANRDAEAERAGLLLTGVDRPGYGVSTPLPGRTIADWIPHAVAVADELGVDRFVAIGESTGGAYSLALASLVPDPLLGVVACCAMTDMRCTEARSTMSRPHCHAVWDAPDRPTALAAAVDSHGEGGSKMTGGGMNTALAPSDVALFQDPTWAAETKITLPAMFAQGLEGYTDDRLADGGGWVTFDVTSIDCPVTVLHSGMDRICNVIHAHHTAEIVRRHV